MRNLLINKYLQIFCIFLLILACGIYYCFQKDFFQAKKDISYYYGLIQNQENINTDVKITDLDLKSLQECKSLGTIASYNPVKLCLRKFYENYTLTNGVEKAFSHLALLQKTQPNFVQDCHYIAHGIGHAQLILDKGNVEDSFALMANNDYYKNITICGNGYFHGVIEEFSKNAQTKEQLLNLLKPVCEDISNKKYRSLDCFHGAGHAAFIQLNANINDGLWVCDNLSDNYDNRFNCYSGLFMEATQDMPLDLKITVTNGKFKLDICDSLVAKYKIACYYQMSSLIEKFTQHFTDHENNIKYCKQIEDPVLRMSCVSVIAATAVSQFHYTKVQDMCRYNTSTSQERVICTGIFATKIAYAINPKLQNQNSLDSIRDICGTLNFLEANKCQKMVKSDLYLLFNPSEKSLEI